MVLAKPDQAFGVNGSGRSLPLQAPAGRQRPRWAAFAFAQLATAALVLLTLIGSIAVLRGSLRPGHEEQSVFVPALDATADAGIPAAEKGEVLLQRTFDVVPSLASWIGIERVALDPGAEMTLGRGQDFGEGPMVYRVETGSLTIQANGPIVVTPAGAQAPVDVAPGTDTVVHAGDALFTPAGVASRWRNDGTTPASVLDAGITTPGSGWAKGFQNGVSEETLIDEPRFTAPDPPVVMTVRRITLQQGETLSVDALPELELLWVESGQLVAVDTASPSTAATPFAFDKGSVMQGSFRPGRVFHSADDAPVTLLVMMIATPQASVQVGIDSDAGSTLSRDGTIS